jgi:hypothetical protein
MMDRAPNHEEASSGRATLTQFEETLVQKSILAGEILPYDHPVT